MVGIAKVSLRNMLVEAGPEAVSEADLQHRMRALRIPYVDAPVIRIALSELEGSDLIFRTEANGQTFFTSRERSASNRIQDWTKRVLGLEQDFHSLPGMVDQHLAEHPAAWAGSAQYVIPRSVLPAFRQESREKRDELRGKYDAPYSQRLREEVLEHGSERCLLLLQCCTSPVHLKYKKIYR